MKSSKLSKGRGLPPLALIKLLSLALLLSLATMAILTPISISEASTKLSVQPSVKKVLVGELFSVNLTVSNVTDLYGWEFKLYYSSRVLNGTSILEGPFLKSSGETFFQIVSFNDAYNSTHGIVWATCTLLGSIPGVNGSGVLATVRFKCVDFGASTLHIETSTLGDSAGDPIPHVREDGVVETWPRNIAVVNVEVSQTAPYQGQTVEVYVTVRNEGNYTESFNLTAYYDGTPIETRLIVGLSPISEAVYTFSWNTLQLEPNVNYTVRAEASVLPGEINTTDNIFVDGTISVRPVVVNIVDVTPCNQTGYALTNFQRGSMAYFKVNITNADIGYMPVLVTVNIFDSDGTVMGMATFQGRIAPGYTVIILGFRIPSIAKTGDATVYANIFDDWPHKGGVPYCPEKSAQFVIEG